MKDKYKIDKAEDLIIFKYENFIPGLLIPIIGYEIFHGNNTLDLNKCKNEGIHFNYKIPVSIDENKL